MASTTAPAVVIIGGSVGGLACAHALSRVGCSVTVFERAKAVTQAGAGLGLGEEACKILRGFGLKDGLQNNSLPMAVELNVAVDDRQADMKVLLRDAAYKHRSLHWSDLHRMLLDALPSQDIMKFGHTVTAIEESSSGKVKATILKASAQEGNGEERFVAEADLIIAADGSMSQTRARYAPPEDHRRYAGYCAWRGVMHEDEHPEVAAAIKAACPEIGSALYFIIAQQTHSVLYSLPGRRLNWLWYINQPEPALKGHSVTAKAELEDIARMHAQAAQTWPGPLADLMTATAAPFVNAIFDREPLPALVHGRVALVGEAAHPTTPHALRSTNMAICDAGALASTLTSHPADLGAALRAYEAERCPATAREVLFSRHLGRLKQGLAGAPPAAPPVCWVSAPPHACQQLAQANMRTFDVDAPAS